MSKIINHRNINIKTSLNIPLKWLQLNCLKTSNIGKDLENPKYSFIADMNVRQLPDSYYTLESWEFLMKLNVHPSHDSRILLLVCSQEK